MKILLLDPDEYYHAQFSEHCSDLGEIRGAKEVYDIKTVLREFFPDIVIMELLLSPSHGYQILAQLKELPHPNRPPVIIFSQIDHLEDIEQALGLGAIGYFVKGKDTINDIKKLLIIYDS